MKSTRVDSGADGFDGGYSEWTVALSYVGRADTEEVEADERRGSVAELGHSWRDSLSGRIGRKATRVFRDSQGDRRCRGEEGLSVQESILLLISESNFSI